MKHLIKLFIFSATILLTGCFTVIHYPDQARLCTDNKEPWNKHQQITIPSEKGDDYISYNVYDVLNNQSHYNDGQNYWIQMKVYNTLNKRVSYQTDRAYLRTPGGILKADPVLYLAKEGKKSGLPGDSRISDLKNVPLGTTVFIRFPITNPLPGDDWIISLGEYEFLQNKIKIPDYKLCRLQGEVDVRRYRGAF